jgi:hypothetical protein
MSARSSPAHPPTAVLTPESASAGRASLLRRALTGLREGVAARFGRWVTREMEQGLEGFRAHGWSGKLFLMLNGVAAVSGTITLPIGVATGRLGVLFGGPVFLLVFGGALVWLDWAMLRGVARFRRGWRNVAIAFSALVGLAGITMVVGDTGLAGRLIGLSQIGLGGQFLVYFVRNRHLFLSTQERKLIEWRGSLPASPEGETA